jgi:hypothetical protein
MIAYAVEDEGVALRAGRGVVAGIVDHVVGANRSHKVDTSRPAHARHLSAERLGDLDGECAHAARGAVDQDVLPRLKLTFVAKALERGHPGDRYGGCLLERDVGWLQGQLVLGCTRVLGERAPAGAEYGIAWLKTPHALADGLDFAGEIDSRIRWLGFA